MMKANGVVTILLCMVLAAGVSAAAEFGEEFAQATEVFNSYYKEEGSSWDEAMTKFAALDERSPNNPAVLVYMGSLETLKARDAWMPWTKIKWVEMGLERIDLALEKIAPSHDGEVVDGVAASLLTRIVAVDTFLSVPGFLNRMQDANDVFADMVDSVAFESADKETLKTIYGLGLKIAERDEKTVDVEKWRKKIAKLAD
ncbi:MAG: hypothetical protein ABW168_01060 [Sedimenticola sp.]